MIYMDNAATTKMTPAVIQAMLLCMEDIWYNPSSLYAPAQRAAEALRDARARIAACLNASPDEIIFTSGAARRITRRLSPLPKQAHRPESGTSFPRPLSTTPSCTPWRSWSGRAIKLNCWMLIPMASFPSPS